jgi:type II protein arginine methyltransferase
MPGFDRALPEAARTAQMAPLKRTRTMDADTKLETMIAAAEGALAGRPNYAVGIIALAEVVAAKKRKVRAYELTRKALAAAPDDPEVIVRARRLMHGLAPGYHVRMMNDPDRNAAWDSALRRAVGPDTRALEIGTGAGMLALMAARAGARKVTTCESSPLMALLATQIVERNGYADRVDVIDKASADLAVGVDLDAPADLLFCDIFGDDLFDFSPLVALEDAKRRLCRPGVRVVPAACALRVALAHRDLYASEGRIESAAGFDLGPFSHFAPATIRTPVGARDLTLLSEPAEIFRFELAAPDLPRDGTSEVTLVAARDAVVTGLVHWIRLELDEDAALEARPAPGASGFSSAMFWPLPEPIDVKRGEPVRVCAAHTESNLYIWRPAPAC